MLKQKRDYHIICGKFEVIDTTYCAQIMFRFDSKLAIAGAPALTSGNGVPQAPGSVVTPTDVAQQRRREKALKVENVCILLLL